MQFSRLRRDFENSVRWNTFFDPRGLIYFHDGYSWSTDNVSTVLMVRNVEAERIYLRCRFFWQALQNTR